MRVGRPVVGTGRGFPLPQYIRNADKIFVFQDGKVVEQGTHDELIASGSTYSHMWDTYTRETIGEE